MGRDTNLARVKASSRGHTVSATPQALCAVLVFDHQEMSSHRNTYLWERLVPIQDSL
jgi:hypothetical protein